MSNLAKYEDFCASTDRYSGPRRELLGLGLCSEAGEVASVLKKASRDKIDELEARSLLLHELGDVMWYIARLASEFDSSLGEIIELNEKKLRSRMERGTLHGSGDHR